MPEFKPNVTVVQPEPLVSVDIKRADPLPAGKYRFRLVVVDNETNESDPAFIDIIIRDKGRPTAILDIVNADRAPVEAEVPVGASFFLSGERSSDPDPGKVVSYQFTLIDAPR
jgi:hypothetical protein